MRSVLITGAGGGMGRAAAKLLRDSGLIVSRRDGKEVYYKASECERAQALHRMIEQVESISCRNITADVGGAGHSHAESERNVVRRRIR